MPKSDNRGSVSWASLTFTIAVLIVITTVPVVVFVLESPGNESEGDGKPADANFSLTCGLLESASALGYKEIGYDNLTTSVCRQYLPWIPEVAYHLQSVSNASVAIVSFGSDCEFQQKERDLAAFLKLTALASDECSPRVISLVCRYYYRPCLNETTHVIHWPTRDECLEVKQNFCKHEWAIARDFWKSSDYCLRIPNCDLLPVLYQQPKHTTEAASWNLPDGSQYKFLSTDILSPSLFISATHSTGIDGANSVTRGSFLLYSSAKSATDSLSLASMSSIITSTASSPSPNPTPVLLPEEAVNGSTLSCNPPFVPSVSSYGSCSPPCPADEWLVPKDAIVVLKSINYVCAVIWLTSILIIFYTWARVKDLWCFPHIVTLVIAAFYLIPALCISIPIIFGRREMFCTHDDFFSTLGSPSSFCIGQGAVFQFSFLSSILWWCFSVFNVKKIVFSETIIDREFKRSLKGILIVETLLSIIIPSAIVSTVLFTTSYDNDRLLVLCVPRDYDVSFYSYTLPTQIISVAATTMAILIIKRVKQSSNLRLREGAITNRNNVISQVSFTRHFLVLVTGTPLVFLSAFTMLEAYSTFWLGKDDLQTRNYIICKQTTDGTDCSSPPNSVGFVAVSAIISVGFTSFAVLLLVFALSPRPARDLWMSHIRKILKKRTAEDRKHFTLELQESSTLP